MKLLNGIVNANYKIYNPDTFFYSLSYEKDKKYRYLVITSEMWSMVKSSDYTGVLKIKDASFLLRGDFQKEQIFKKIDSHKVIVKLKKMSDPRDLNPFIIEPVLQGIYRDCQNRPINIEVYVEKAIPGFQMNHRRPLKSGK